MPKQIQNDHHQGGDKSRWSAIAAWCLYDWAASTFPVIVTIFIFAPYFTESVATDAVTGTVLWGRAMAAAGFVIAVSSALLGSISDLKGGRKRWLMVSAGLAMVATATLWFVAPNVSAVPLALVGGAVAVVAFETAAVFYNSMLPEVAPAGYFGRVSGWGNGAGALGGIVCLGVVLVLFVLEADSAPFGLDPQAQEAIRICLPFAALWWLVFALPLFLLVSEDRLGGRGGNHPWRTAIRHGTGNLVNSLRALPREPRLAWYLLAQMLYCDGLNTVLSFSGIFAAGTFGMDVSELLVYGIAVNVAAGVGSLAFGWVDDRMGAKRAVVIGLSGMIVFIVAIIATDSKTVFWLASVMVGVFLGPVQAASRSLMAGMTTPENRARMFGLYAVSGKITAFLGPAAFSIATDLAGSQRAGMAVTIPFFVLGLALLVGKVKGGEV
ncbi:MFS transporter family transporter protein [Paramagnetospirillum caucaseum]|uniref:MFS transporter family transporter protein n=1 Tax=Paramagnetospirillum caucaseum TaxID=1244869 RepID=M3A979_9PROT|nr:MFS transporter [Paramagnetospirillum caucaseum]EME69049.1 MFS transporter family transporter protein [Paramagnetospirillum caucaseum]